MVSESLLALTLPLWWRSMSVDLSFAIGRWEVFGLCWSITVPNMRFIALTFRLHLGG